MEYLITAFTIGSIVALSKASDSSYEDRIERDEGNQRRTLKRRNFGDRFDDDSGYRSSSFTQPFPQRSTAYNNRNSNDRVRSFVPHCKRCHGDHGTIEACRNTQSAPITEWCGRCGELYSPPASYPKCGFRGCNERVVGLGCCRIHSMMADAAMQR